MHLFFSSATWCAHTHTQVFAFSSLARWWWADAADNRSPGRRRRRMQEVGAPYTLSSIWLWWWRGVASGRALIIIIIPIAFPAKQLLSRGPVHHQANCKRYLDYFLQQDLFCLVLVFIYRSGGQFFFFFLLERHACYTLGCCVGLLDPLLFSTLVECNCNGRPDHPNGCVLLVPQR